MKRIIASLFATLLTLSPLVALADHNFRVTNRGDHSIVSVYISSPTIDSWQNDLLPADEVIYPNQYENFYIRQGCVEDIKIVYNDGKSSIDRNWDTCAYGLDTHY